MLDLAAPDFDGFAGAGAENGKRLEFDASFAHLGMRSARAGVINRAAGLIRQKREQVAM
jgi:hypothetical protein